MYVSKLTRQPLISKMTANHGTVVLSASLRYIYNSKDYIIP